MKINTSCRSSFHTSQTDYIGACAQSLLWTPEGLYIWLSRWERPLCCRHVKQRACLSLPRLGGPHPSWNKMAAHTAVKVWQQQQVCKSLAIVCHRCHSGKCGGLDFIWPELFLRGRVSKAIESGLCITQGPAT